MEIRDLVGRIFIILFFLSSCRASLVATSKTSDENTKEYTYDPETIICNEHNGAVLNLVNETTSTKFCRIGRALISTHSLFNFYVNQTSNEALNLFLHDSDIKKDNSRKNRRLITYAMGNPAILYCLQNNGDSRTYKDSERKIVICAFKDGSEISAWTLFNGPKNSIELADILKSNVENAIISKRE